MLSFSLANTVFTYNIHLKMRCLWRVLIFHYLLSIDNPQCHFFGHFLSQAGLHCRFLHWTWLSTWCSVVGCLWRYILKGRGFLLSRSAHAGSHEQLAFLKKNDKRIHFSTSKGWHILNFTLFGSEMQAASNKACLNFSWNPNCYY